MAVSSACDTAAGPIAVQQNERILHLAQVDFCRVVLRAGALQRKAACGARYIRLARGQKGLT